MTVMMLAGCAVTAPGGIPHGFDAGGIQLTDSPLRIDFGRTYDSTIPAMARLTGRPPVAEGPCPGGGRFADWPGETRLVFSPGGAFAGWQVAGGSAGRGCG